MALLTPDPLVLVWNVLHGLTEFYGGDGGEPGWDVLLPPDAIIRGGWDHAGSDTDRLGCTLIVFDPATGEPLSFASHTMVDADNGEFRGIYHFPAEDCVVLFGVALPSTHTSKRVYAQRVYYDVGAGTLTPDSLATWSPNPSGTNAKVDFFADVPSSGVVNVFGYGAFNASVNTLTPGSAGTPTTYTVDDLTGGGRDRFLLFALGAQHGEGLVRVSAFVNASGSGTAVEFIIPFAAAASTGAVSGWPTGTDPIPNALPIDGDRTMVPGLTTHVMWDSGGLTSVAASEVYNDATIHAVHPQWTYITGDTDVIAFTREGASFGAGNDLRARQHDPDTGAEVAAWEYPGSYVDYPSVGVLSESRQFWWGDFTETVGRFRVYEGPPLVTGNPWTVGRVAWGTRRPWH